MRVPLRTALVPALLSVLAVPLAACGTSSTPASPSAPTSAAAASAAPSTSSTPSTPDTSPTPTSPSPPSQTAGSDAVVVNVQVSGGRVRPGLQTMKVKAGQKVTITATSDVADSIHVHGYDKTLDLPAGEAASVSFVADVRGVFEVETHETELLVAKLAVT